jgi:hypothetical protein
MALTTSALDSAKFCGAELAAGVGVGNFSARTGVGAAGN